MNQAADKRREKNFSHRSADQMGQKTAVDKAQRLHDAQFTNNTNFPNSFPQSNTYYPGKILRAFYVIQHST